MNAFSHDLGLQTGIQPIPLSQTVLHVNCYVKQPFRKICKENILESRIRDMASPQITSQGNLTLDLSNHHKDRPPTHVTALEMIIVTVACVSYTQRSNIIY